MKTKQKAPLSYYGGKQNMLSHILPLIPKHEIYVEPFAGGAAVFFAKRSCKVEVLNDQNDRLITFYRQLETNFDALNKIIQGTLHSESDHIRAKAIYKNPDDYNAVEVAWAVWVQCNMSFSNKILGGFAYNNNYRSTGGGNTLECKRQKTRKKEFHFYKKRLNQTAHFSRPFHTLPEIYNKPESFYYFDPPYYGSNCGHYGGWTEDDEIRLLEYCKSRKGKFLLSGYPNKIRNDYIKKEGWNYKEIDKPLSVDGRNNSGKRKTETLIYNYEKPYKQQSLF